MSRERTAAAAGGAIAALAVVAIAAARIAGGSFAIDSGGLTGGGGLAEGGSYELRGAIGQPFVHTVQGSGFVLAPGVLSGAAAGEGVPVYELIVPGLAANP